MVGSSDGWEWVLEGEWAAGLLWRGSLQWVRLAEGG